MKYVIFFLFIFGVTVGLLFSYHVMDDIIYPCFFMGEGSFCVMSVFEHLSKWSLQFAGVIGGISDGIILLFLGLFVSIFFPICVSLLLPWVIRVRSLVAKIHDYIVKALSNGILHPKLHA